MKTALLLSGGMDSTALAYWLRPQVAVTIDYGQLPAPAEIRASKAISETLHIEHHIIKTDLSALGSGDMSGKKALKEAPASDWWPYRNQMIITLAAMKVITLEVNQLLIGTLKNDEQHADGRPDFVQTLDKLLQIQEGKITLKAPAINMSGTELIKKSGIPMEVLAWSHSCHVSEYACGKCRGCYKHYHILEELGETPY